MMRFQYLKQRWAAMLVALSFLLVGGVASATEPTEPEAAFSELESLVDSFEGYAWPLVTAVAVALIGIKLFKKFAGRAS